MTNFAHPVSFLFFSFSVFANALTDTILQGQSVTTSTTITSSGNKFELGFFTPGNGNSATSSHLGIWYKGLPERTVVWVANRDNPVTGSSKVLTIEADGNLVILDVRLSYKVSTISSSANTSATLLDSGNLVLIDRRSGNLLWQSFDYPSDTFLPGMKLGYDKRNGKTWYLLAWKSEEDPSPGVFSVEADPEVTNQFFILQGSQKYWTTGIWNGQFFSQMPEMNQNYLFKFSYVSNDNESYYTYSMYNSSIISRFVLDTSGLLQQLTWLETTSQWNLFWSQPTQRCYVNPTCGAFGACNPSASPFCQCLRGFEPNSVGGWNAGDTSGGCVRKAPLQCGNDSAVNGRKDQFLRIAKVRLPDNSIVLSQVKSVGDCKSACFSNCSCSAYTYSVSGCSIWGNELLNVVQLMDGDPEGKDFYLRLAASEFPSQGKGKWIIPALVVPMTLLAIVSFFYCWRRRKSQNKGEDLVLFDLGTSIGATGRKLNEAGKSHTGKKKEVDLPLAPYQGKLQKGDEVAVKRLSRKSRQGLEELQNEALLIAKLQHKNLAWDLWKSGRGERIKDPILQDISSTNMLLRYINIALLCVQESAADRPTMSDVISMLSNEHMLLASPKQPAFSTSRSMPDQNSSKPFEICSINDLTVSILEAR
ncbi:hypothetical protein RHSIM_RhsimUnG0256700 [Rhododendron simsii]|uniref:Uncharacterized protein n=1 Tax=Rhododendron simsii TaxID=118357 RepID=A0A834FT68_RHOSS|nr:hypothetical protein RHSIM_RhsimUnG0256700 [Rhododendron simsii]